MGLLRTFAVLTCLSTCAHFTTSAFAQERGDQPTTSARIAFLEPVIGDWQGTATVGDGQSKATIKYRWINNKNFVLQSIDCPEIELSVNHVIGWDPTSGSVTAWGFGGSGGHGQMVWTKKGPMSWTEESKDWTAPDGQSCHFVLETKIVDDKLEISGFFASDEQGKIEIVMNATKAKH